MRKSKVLDKVRTGRCARICGLGHYLPFFVRYAAHNGYDGIWLDLEHRAMDQREVQGLLALCRLGLRLGVAGGDVDLDQAVAKVAAAAKKHGKAWGIPAGTPELLAKYRAQGAQMLAYGGDFALAQVLAACRRDFDQALGE